MNSFIFIVFFLACQILAPRIGYLPLLVPQIKPFFSSTLPPGADTVWFEYKGLPLKWYAIIPLHHAIMDLVLHFFWCD